MPKAKIILILLFFSSILVAEENQKANLKKAVIKSAKYFDINRIKAAIQNNGFWGRHPVNGSADFFLGSAPLIYSSGLWIGALVDGKVRASTADFSTDFMGGGIDSSGKPYGKSDSAFRVYKISKGDNAANNPDYENWPTWLGAPSDEMGNPLLIGDQTLWCCFTDSYLEDRILQGADLPLGAEVHLTAFGWEKLVNILFLRWEIINKSPGLWEGTYFGVFSDPDVGDASNDLIVSDSTLNLVCCYDGYQQWSMWRNHAVGYQLLETPTISSSGDTAVTFWGLKTEFKNKPVYAPLMEKNLGSGGWNDISYDNKRPVSVYNRLKCLNIFGEPAIDPITNQPSKWAFSGDPVSGSGWLDTIVPRDRRMMLSTGPINVSPGDTCALMLAIICVQNNIMLENIVDIKREAAHLKQSFAQPVRILASANAAEKRISDSEWQVDITASIIKKDTQIGLVKAEIYDYHNSLIQELVLFDDGAHADGQPDDNIYGNSWISRSYDQSLFMNLIVIGEFGHICQRDHVISDITLSNKLVYEPIIIQDSQNYDGVPNPGENIRLIFAVKNNYAVNIHQLCLTSELIDPFFSVRDRNYTFFLDSVKSGEFLEFDHIYNRNIKYSTYYDLNIPEDYPINQALVFLLEAYDDAHHHWKDTIQVVVKPLEYVPHEIVPVQVAGKSSANFLIRMVNPPELTDHSYSITITDSLSTYYFNLFDNNTNYPLLIKSPLPDMYAYNIPITDGFKIVKANIPKEGISAAYYQDVAGGHVAGLDGVNFGGEFFNGGVRVGTASSENIYSLEIEFMNNIGVNGVIGNPNGQLAYRYLYNSQPVPSAIQPNSFLVWKTWRGEKVSPVNVCFYEKPNSETCDGLWAPDTTKYGGNEILFVMTTDYDPTGTYYLNKPINPHEVMFKLSFRLKSDSSVVDAGDKFIVQWEHAPTSEDRWEFTPTKVNVKNKSLPLAFELHQNFPNPFNETTMIRFSVDKPSKISLKIFNYLGQEVIRLLDKEFLPGEHSVFWDGKNNQGLSVGSGLYFGVLKREQQDQIIKVLCIH